MRLCECRIFFLLFLAGAAPTTSPTTQMSDAELKDPAFWLRRAEVDWRQIASPLETPWPNSNLLPVTEKG